METLADIAKELGGDMERLQYAGKTVTVKFKVSRSFYLLYSSLISNSYIRMKVRVSCVTRLGG